MKEIAYTRAALRSLGRVPKPVADRIRAKIVGYATDPALQANNVTALKGRDAIRMRVGDWRVIMHDGVVLAIPDVGPRGGVYD